MVGKLFHLDDDGDVPLYFSHFHNRDIAMQADSRHLKLMKITESLLVKNQETACKKNKKKKSCPLDAVQIARSADVQLPVK